MRHSNQRWWWSEKNALVVFNWNSLAVLLAWHKCLSRHRMNEWVGGWMDSKVSLTHHLSFIRDNWFSLGLSGESCTSQPQQLLRFRGEKLAPQEVVTVNVLNGPTGRDSWRRTPPPLVGWMMAGCGRKSLYSACRLRVQRLALARVREAVSKKRRELSLKRTTTRWATVGDGGE